MPPTLPDTDTSSVKIISKKGRQVGGSIASDAEKLAKPFAL
jgi:hypothetical protein